MKRTVILTIALALLPLCLRLCQAAIGNFRIGKDDSRNRVWLDERRDSQ